MRERHSGGFERRSYEGADGEAYTLEIEASGTLDYTGETADGVRVSAGGSSSGGYTAEVALPRKMSRARVSIPCPEWLTGEITAVIDYGDGVVSVVSTRSDGEWLSVALKGDADIRFMSGGVFTDVTAGAWYYESALWAASEGLTAGLFGSELGADLTSQRALTVTLLYRALGRPDTRSTASPFFDVLPGSYCFEAVRWAVSAGVTTGATETLFDPDGSCTRAHALTFLYRAAGQPRPERAQNPFADVPADAYYRDAVLWAVEEGITTGTSPSAFSPDLACTRAEIITFLYRASPLLDDSGKWD